jgi:hypothetical protein
MLYYKKYFFFIYCESFLQSVSEGWYDGGSILFAVILVILVTGNYHHYLF